MKKVLTTLLVAGMFAFVACGPSAEEKAAAEKKKQDSIDAVQKAMNDSIATAQAAVEKAKTDSMNMAAAEKAKADSMAAAEAASKGKKGGKKK